MKTDTYVGFCPFEIGDVVVPKNKDTFGEAKLEIFDIHMHRSLRNQITEFDLEFLVDGKLSCDLHPARLFLLREQDQV